MFKFLKSCLKKKKNVTRELSASLWLKVFSVWPFAEEIC